MQGSLSVESACVDMCFHDAYARHDDVFICRRKKKQKQQQKKKKAIARKRETDPIVLPEGFV